MRNYVELRSLNSTGTMGFTIPRKMIDALGIPLGSLYKIKVTENQIIFDLINLGDE